ncbi:MAG: ISKra4 family transposase [Candidatus Marinimicrobia bacterium]|nr:ISKra4 family transposase [Candidatus Neomarinimicrobiota bacterium]
MEHKDKMLQEIKQKFEGLLSTILQTTDQVKRIDEVELHIFRVLLNIGKRLISLYIEDSVNRIDKSLNERFGIGYQNKGKFTRFYFSLFGQIKFIRRKIYISKERTTLFPADKELGIPKEKYSYNLQDWIGYSATDTDFRSSVELINRIFEHNILEMQSERIANLLSAEVENFYESTTILPKEKEGNFYAAGFDDKGVPILPSDAGRESDSNGVRLGKGQKRGVKKSSTVSVTYSFAPCIRTAEEVISNLFHEDKNKSLANNQAKSTNKQAKNKHIRAFLSNKKKAIEYGFENIKERTDGEEKNIVVLIDGDRGLEKAVDRAIETKEIKHRIIFKVLDFIHVTEYIWKAANIYFGEKSQLRLDWVKEQCLALLQGKTMDVIENLQELIQHSKYKTAKHKTIKSVIRYLLNHKHMMHYKECLARGFPISTGAIESACGHFVQSRMERNGMRWSIKGATNMLNLRAVNKNKDWEGYIQHYIKKKQKHYEIQRFKNAA